MLCTTKQTLRKPIKVEIPRREGVGERETHPPHEARGLVVEKLRVHVGAPAAPHPA
jgi:hypothetical protein